MKYLAACNGLKTLMIVNEGELQQKDSNLCKCLRYEQSQWSQRCFEKLKDDDFCK